MNTGLNGKTVLITESALNFGRATALAFAAEGANLVLATADSSEQMEQTANQASALGVRVVTGVCDIGDESQVQGLVAKGIGEFRHLDVLVINSLFPLPDSPFDEIPLGLWKQKIHQEVTGPVFICKEVLPLMIERSWGRIINFAGLSGFQGSDAPSSTTELGIVGLTRGIAHEYGKHNITANCVCPGGIEAPQELGRLSFPPREGDPLPRWGTEGEVAFLAVFLASEDAGYVTGQCLLPNGGKYFL